MAFVKYLEDNVHQPYATYYIRYRDLCSAIPRKGMRLDADSGSAPENGSFLEKYENNFATVFDFIRCKYGDIEAVLGYIEEKINNKRASAQGELQKLLAEMRCFAEFIRVNTEGFLKVIKKYHRRTGTRLPTEYRRRVDTEMGKIDGLNKLIYATSRLKLKTMKIREKAEDGTSFVRKTNKYWVHSENLAALKAKIVENLPVYVFNSGTRGGTPYCGWDYTTHDTCVSSVYFDNVWFELYHGRLKKLQGAEAIRIRWYGVQVPDIVFVERKRHEESWTGEKSKKLRFKIYEKDVINFINGNDVWPGVKELNGNRVKRLYREIQSVIINKNLRPMVRTFYKRNAFQLPNDSSVRISLDTNLTMIRECSGDEFQENKFPLGQWRRPDVYCDWPFADVQEDDVVRFPHAVLEIKTQGVDESKPEWIEKLLASSLVEHVHKFSKYMHGCASFFSSITTIPYWLPQVKTDIRKDPYHSRGHVWAIIDNRLVGVPGESEATTSENLNPIFNHGKKIAMPVRIEPKIHLANERTFLKWIKFGIFLGGVGTTMTSIGDSDAWLCGCILIIVAVVFSFYALYLWYWRNTKIYLHDLRPYDDRYGPILLISVYIVAMMIIVFFKFTLDFDEVME